MRGRRLVRTACASSTSGRSESCRLRQRGRFCPLEPLGILAAPIFKQALDNSQQLCLGWSFTLGASLSLNTLGQLEGPTPTILGSSRSPVTMDVMFKLFDNELLITDNAFHHVANRNYTN